VTSLSWTGKVEPVWQAGRARYLEGSSMSSVNVAGRSRTYLWRAFHTGGLFAGQLISRDLPQHAVSNMPGLSGLSWRASASRGKGRCSISLCAP
jgi:hypothetical protein